MIIDKPLYHGTDLNIIEFYNKSELEKIKKDATKIIQYMYPIYKENYFYKNSSPDKREEERLFCDYKRKCLGENYQSINDSISVAAAFNSPNYDYNNFYVTTSLSRAQQYAKRAKYFGEIGYISYNLILGAKLLNYKIDFIIINESLNSLKNFWEIPPKPVVYEFINIDSTLLRTRDNKNFNPDYLLFPVADFRYMKDPDFTLASKILLNI